MGGELSLADINRPIGEELAKMIISPAVAETQFEHHAIQFPNQIRGRIQAGALSLEPPYKAVEPAHQPCSGRNAGRFTQSLDFYQSGAQLIVCRFEPLSQLLH